MLAAVGYFFREHIPNGGPFGILVSGPANDQLQQIPAPARTTFIARLEVYRANVGWVEPQSHIGSHKLWTLRETYPAVTLLPGSRYIPLHRSSIHLGNT
mmetsp:Transcript_17455/g.35120  ORF Transcript_17455/g.35120 Transcript_17455/m.35120 type:complete len:99 (+) Transcript_17455:415-711(+)